MNGDGGNAVSSHESPQLWVLVCGTLQRWNGSDAVDGIRCQLTAGGDGAVWSAPTRKMAHLWFMAHFAVSVSFEEFDAALRRDYPLAHARMLEVERSEEALGRDFANIHLMTKPPKT